MPVLLLEGPPEKNPWCVSFKQGLFNMTGGSEHFRSREDLEREGADLLGNIFVRRGERFLPLYEAKMLFQFTHRYGDFADVPPGKSSHQLPEVPDDRLADPSYSPLPRYWVPEAEAAARLRDRWAHPFLLAWRDVTDARASARTVIASLLPRVGCGDTVLLMLPEHRDTRLQAILIANLDSFVLDYAARQKVGGTHLKFHVFKQLPVLPPLTYTENCPWSPSSSLADWLTPRVLELVYTAHDLAPFARACGYEGEPFRWDPERRFELRCQLDAAFFHLYGIARDDVDYILDTFPIVRRNDEKQHGSYRTKTRILELFDAYAGATHTLKTNTASR